MKASLTDYTPQEKPPETLSLEDMNKTASNLRSAGMLRMHAMARLLDELCDLADKKGYDIVSDESGFTKAFSERK